METETGGNDAGTIIIATLLVIGIAAYALWRLYDKYWKQSPVSAPTPSVVLTAPNPEPEVSKAVLSLPSAEAQFHFICHLTILRRPLGTEPRAANPPLAAELAVYNTAKEITVNYSLTEKSKLQTRLSHELPLTRKFASAGLAVWAHCDSIEVDADELDHVRRLRNVKFDWLVEQQQTDLLERRAERVGRTLEDPRAATMWWFAQNPGKLDDLPEVAERLYNLDRLINPQNHSVSSSSILGEFGYVASDQTPPPSDGRDLEEFLNDADDAQRAAIGVALMGVYSSLGREDLAGRASRLVVPLGADDDFHAAGSAEPYGPESAE